jgi:prepilin-type N-terminal cleavage/methylation domain-containing protein
VSTGANPLLPRPRPFRRGITLLELLIALAIMTAVAAALGALARAVETGAECGTTRSLLTQHARVCLERISRAGNEAVANEIFPGLLVLDEWEEGYRFPDTLVVWQPLGAAQDSLGLPRLNELVVYCPHPDPSKSRKLVEIRDDRTTALSSDPGQWRAAVAGIKSRAIQAGSSSMLTVLTNRLRTAVAGGRPRGAVRFERRLRPSDEEWSVYLVEAARGAAEERAAWSALSWVQDLRGNSAGLRQAYVRIELQLVAETEDGPEIAPFFGSAVAQSMLTRRRP